MDKLKKINSWGEVSTNDRYNHVYACTSTEGTEHEHTVTQFDSDWMYIRVHVYAATSETISPIIIITDYNTAKLTHNTLKIYEVDEATNNETELDWENVDVKTYWGDDSSLVTYTAAGVNLGQDQKEHYIKIAIQKKAHVTNLSNTFRISGLTSVSFDEFFDWYGITTIQDMFRCVGRRTGYLNDAISRLREIDMGFFYTASTLTNINGFICGATALTTIHNNRTWNLKYISSNNFLFDYVYNIYYLDISNWFKENPKGVCMDFHTNRCHKLHVDGLFDGTYPDLQWKSGSILASYGDGKYCYIGYNQALDMTKIKYMPSSYTVLNSIYVYDEPFKEILVPNFVTSGCTSIVTFIQTLPNQGLTTNLWHLDLSNWNTINASGITNSNALTNQTLPNVTTIDLGKDFFNYGGDTATTYSTFTAMPKWSDTSIYESLYTNQDGRTVSQARTVKLNATAYTTFFASTHDGVTGQDLIDKITNERGITIQSA